MKLITVKIPDSAQKHELEMLSQTCCRHDGIRLSFPFQDAECYFLLYKEELLCSALSLSPVSEGLMECSAFTLPNQRRQGCFSRLLSAALKACPEDDICFVTAPGVLDSQKVLEALDAQYWYSEHLMKLLLPASEPAPASSELELSDPVPGRTLLSLDGAVIGQCRCSSWESGVYLYEFQIEEPFRHKGYGYQFLQLLLSRFSGQNIPSVCLQVSSSNLPAMALYKKTGFQITETLSYYLY